MGRHLFWASTGKRNREVMQSQTYIVRIYRRNGGSRLAGLVETVQSRKLESFHDFDELLGILDRPPHRTTRRTKRQPSAKP